MKKNKSGIWVGCGVASVVLLLVSVWYSVTFNDARLVVPTDLGSYVFQAQDLPMLLSVLLVCVYVFALMTMLLAAIVRNRRQTNQANTTRKLNPKLGYLGLLGFLGFAGFWTYSIDGSMFPFVFFIFFGFFGFYYEGKMSGTFMDERFRENAVRAQLKAYKITFSIFMVALVVLCRGKLFGSLEYTLIAGTIVWSLTLALGIFLTEYLLYRYDHDEPVEESEE